MKIRTLAVLTFLSLAGCAHAQPQPLFGSFPMENAAATEAGPQNLTVKAQNVTPVAGKSGGALRFDGPASKIEISGPRIKDLTVQFSLAFWLKVEKFPATGRVYIVTKGLNNGWQLGIGDKGQVMFHGGYGGGFYDTPWKGKIAPDTWTHVALTFERGGAMRIYLNGQEVLESQVPFAVWRSDDPIRVGNAHWTAAIDDLQIFAAALSSAQVQTLAKGQPLPTRAPTEADFPSQGYPVKLSLGRFDQPLAFRPYDGRRLQDARRMPAPDAVDWPVLKLNGSKRVFKDGPTENAEVVLRGGGESKDLFRDARDNSITPINHWFRANSFLWGRTFVYTTDRTARTSSGDYELWTFPIQIKGENAGDIQSVVLKLGGETIYERGEKLRSLTLLLPANLGGSPYELVVNNRPPVRFDAGLKPVALGKPEDEPLQVNLTIPGGGPKITVQNLAASPVFPHPKEWAADLKALAAGPEFAAPPVPQLAGFGRFLGLSVPRAPVEIFTSSMRHGMSGGHFLGGGHIAGFQGTADEYAAFLASQGYDFAIEDAFPKTLEESVKLDQWMAAMTRRGLKAGVNPDTPGNLGILGNPNLAFQSSFLPEWGAPAFRDAQLLAQRFGKYPAFLGLLIGADNGGYVTYWDWAPTIPDRPWGRAYEIFQQGRARVTPVGPALSPSKSWEKKATQREFLNYIARYDETFKRYGYFARAVQEVRPDAILTTGSYGSSPGGGGRGGWPWATIPGVPMHENLPVQTAYDWNEHGSSKPLHNLALVDRLQSYFPQKPTWALIDDFGLFFGREARQRAYALALTRGVDAVGTTFLAHETGDQNYRSGQMVRFEETPRERPAVVREQRELYDWIHRTSGAYQSARPLASVGVLYIHQQAVSRQIQGSEKPTEKDLYGGSHEGKTRKRCFCRIRPAGPPKSSRPKS